MAAERVRNNGISAVRDPGQTAAPIKRYMDYTLLLIVVILLAFGYIMRFSVSGTASWSALTDDFPELPVALGVMALLAWLPYTWLIKKWRNLIWLIYAACIILGILPKVIGRASHGQTRWITIAGTSLQPSEIVKAGLIIFTAAIISRIPRKLQTDRYVMVYLILCTLPVALVATTNLSTGIIIFGICWIMLYIASQRRAVFFFHVGICAAAALLYSLLKNTYQVTRIKDWLSGSGEGGNYQTTQSLYAIGSGGFFGKGLGESIQKWILPESGNDMIFAIVCEELGIFGGICLVLLYLALLWRIWRIARTCRDMFGSYLAIGVMVHLGMQFVLNMCVATRLLPNTGASLPLISSGGSALLGTLAEIGLVLSVSRNTSPELDGIEEEAYGRKS